MECAWCGKPIVSELKSESRISLEENISHTICLQCISEMHLFKEVDLSEKKSDLYILLPLSKATLDKNNKILYFATHEEKLSTTLLQNVVGKNYFNEIIPFLTNNDIRRKLGGLRRRKKDGQQLFYVLLKHRGNLSLIQLELNHFVKKGETVVSKVKIREEA